MLRIVKILMMILSYTFRHKWFVMSECFKEGLYLQGLLHDIDKFLPSMLVSYGNFFYGQRENPRNDDGYYKPIDTGNMAFEMSWHKHIHRNKHHWQWWIRYNDDGRIAVFDMEECYVKEMICDWVGAGKAQGFLSPPEDRFYETRKWYKKNKKKMTLSPKTRKYIEKYLEYNN